MFPRVIAGLVVVGLAIGIWVLWPREEPAPPPTTTVHAVASSTSTKVATRTTASSIVETQVVTTVEEAEEILRQLWFGWFEGIYNQDEERIKEVVATQAALDNAVAQFGVMEFSEPPSPEKTMLSNVEILESDETCVVIWAGLNVSGFRPNAIGTEGVYVLRGAGGGWYLASVWQYRDDLWNADCESLFVPLS